MDTQFILDRFYNEKQILAHFDHANIAKLLDGGTTPDRRPYFVLEFIAGKPIDAYCRERQLSIDERLRLFQRVCTAVEYAHQNLIVHRDLKPRNILVTAEGEPKLLDFGIAKILSDERELTVAGVRPMTPEYASPEQIRGEAISTVTDIYSLGVILYELLTDQRPFASAGASPHETARLILESEPRRPSAALRNVDDKRAKRLKGDLDNIVLKAMRPEPQRRYQAVGELSNDIDRYFGRMPVIAAGDSLGYRARKFALRHRTAVIGGVMVFLSLAGGLVFVQREAVVARQQRAVAEQHAAEIRRLANSLIFDLHDAIESLPGATPVRAKLMDRAAEALDGLATNAESDPSIQFELAGAYQRLADVQGAPMASNLGNLKPALSAYRKALTILERLQKRLPRNLDAQRRMAAIEWRMSTILSRQGDADAATTMAQRAVDLREKVAAAEPRSLQSRRDLGTAYRLRGQVAVLAGDLATARTVREKALQVWKSVAAEDAGDTDAKFQVSLAAKNLAAVEQRFQDFTAAANHLEEARRIDEQRIQAAPQDAGARLDLSFDFSEMAELSIRRNDLAAAAEFYRQARSIREDLLRDDAGNQRLNERVAYIRSREGRVLTELGRLKEARGDFDRALSLRRALADVDPTNLESQFSVAESQGDFGAWYCAAGMRAAGRTMLERALGAIEALERRGALHVEERESAAELRARLDACAAK
jgi:tetratricopeptide (TPR) repeat protein